jgi:hypothetical protein
MRIFNLYLQEYTISVVERLASSGKTLGTNSSSVVNGRHRHVTSVSRDFNLVILNDVLLKDSVTAFSKLRLLLSMSVEISFRKETVVTRDVVGNFRSTDGQLIVHILHLLVVLIQVISRVVTVGSQCAAVFCLEE